MIHLVCERCGAAPELLANIGHELVCADCWKAAGRPFPPPARMAAVHEAEAKTRERMIARGGAHAHLVRKGLS